MKIKLEKQKGYYTADCLDLPGSPPVGNGKTKELAMACLFYLMKFESPHVGSDRTWFDYIKLGEPITVNGVMWEQPTSFSKR